MLVCGCQHDRLQGGQEAVGMRHRRRPPPRTPACFLPLPAYRSKPPCPPAGVSVGERMQLRQRAPTADLSSGTGAGVCCGCRERRGDHDLRPGNFTLHSVWSSFYLRQVYVIQLKTVTSRPISAWWHEDETKTGSKFTSTNSLEKYCRSFRNLFHWNQRAVMLPKERKAGRLGGSVS